MPTLLMLAAATLLFGWRRRFVRDVVAEIQRKLATDDPFASASRQAPAIRAQQLAAAAAADLAADLAAEEADQYAPRAGTVDELARDELARIIAARTPSEWARCASAEHYRTIADRVIARGWRPGVDVDDLDVAGLPDHVIAAVAESVTPVELGAPDSASSELVHRVTAVTHRAAATAPAVEVPTA